jgi:hypothetical protein
LIEKETSADLVSYKVSGGNGEMGDLKIYGTN